MAKSFPAPSTARSITTQEPAWVVWSGFLLPAVICIAIGIVLWRQSQPVWAYPLLLLVLAVGCVRQYQRIKFRSTLFLQFTDNQWYVVDHLGELHEVYLLHNWRSPWWLSLEFTDQIRPVATRYALPSITGARSLFAWQKLNVTLWRQKITINHWRDINLALSRYNAYAGSQQTKEPS